MRLKKITPCILCALLLSGCWDKVEIDRKIFISVIAIDLGKDAGQDKEVKKLKPDDPFQERAQQRKLNITYGFPDISELGPGKSGTAKNQFISVEASSMDDGINQATSRSSRDIDIGQTKLIMFSSAVLEQPDIFKEVIDYLERDPNLNKMMQVIAVEGKAEDYIKYKPPMEKNVEAYLTGLMESSKKTATILPVTLNELMVLLDQNGNGIVPRVSTDKEKHEVMLSGLAVIKDYKLKGYLTPVEVSDLELMRGKLRSGRRVIYKDTHPVDISIDDMSREISVGGDKNKLKFNIDIKLEGQIKEYYKGGIIFSKQELNSLEEDFNKSISQQCNIIAKMLQREFTVDPIGFREYLQKYKPGLWKEVKDKWEESYKNADINVTVDSKIRRIGVIR